MCARRACEVAGEVCVFSEAVCEMGYALCDVRRGRLRSGPRALRRAQGASATSPARSARCVWCFCEIDQGYTPIGAVFDGEDRGCRWAHEARKRTTVR